MSSKHLALRLLALVAIAAILVGCASPSPTATSTTVAPTVDQQPTFNAVKTQAAQTIVANLTQNAPPTAIPVTPTNTPSPTGTATLTSTPLPPINTATATFIPWTLTPTIGAFSCSVTSVSPKATDKLSPSTAFDGTWVIKNIGTETWQHKEIDIHYVSGQKFQENPDLILKDMTDDVTTGNSYTVIVDMISPADAGTYTAVWSVAKGKDILCTLNLTVVVVK